MTAAPTQTQRILAALRAAGPRGITQLDFDTQPVDGGKPIRRVASRITELRDAGHLIDSSGRRFKMAVYVLVEDAEGVPVVAAPEPAASTQPTSLFAEVQPLHSPRSAFDPDGDWA